LHALWTQQQYFPSPLPPKQTLLASSKPDCDHLVVITHGPLMQKRKQRSKCFLIECSLCFLNPEIGEEIVSLPSCFGPLPSLPAGLLPQDGHVRTLTSIDQFSGLCLSCSHPCPATSDEVLLQPCLQRVSQQLLC